MHKSSGVLNPVGFIRYKKKHILQDLISLVKYEFYVRKKIAIIKSMRKGVDMEARSTFVLQFFNLRHIFFLL